MNEASPQGSATASVPSRRRGRKLVIGLGCGLAILVAGWFVLKPWLLPRLQAWDHVHSARSELKNYHNPQALRHLKECMRQWPDDPDLLLLTARAERRALHYAEAERLLERYQEARGLDDAYSFEQLLLTAERRVDRVADQCWRFVENGHEDTVLILEALTR